MQGIGTFRNKSRNSTIQDARQPESKAPRASTLTRVFDQDVFDAILSSIYAVDASEEHTDSISAECGNTWCVEMICFATMASGFVC